MNKNVLISADFKDVTYIALKLIFNNREESLGTAGRLLQKYDAT